MAYCDIRVDRCSFVFFIWLSENWENTSEPATKLVLRVEKRVPLSLLFRLRDTVEADGDCEQLSYRSFNVSLGYPPTVLLVGLFGVTANHLRFHTTTLSWNLVA